MEILTRQRRNEQAQSLRHDDQSQDAPPVEAQRQRRFPLALVDRQDARADELRDEGGIVDRERDDEGDDLGIERGAAFKIEAAEMRHADARVRLPECHDEQDRDDGAVDRARRSRFGRAAAPPASHEPDCCRDKRCGCHEICPACIHHGAWESQAAVGKECRAEQRPCLPRAGQGAKRYIVPDENMQESRQIADDFDIDQRKAGDGGIGGQSGDANQEPKQSRKRNGEDRDQQRVGQADKKNPAVAARLRIGDRAEADRKSRLSIKKAEIERQSP